jgi:Flp pilus assembly protein TadG
MAMAAFSLIGLCALVGLAVDTGYFFDSRRRLQTAADAAALAGAEQLRRAGTTQPVTAANAAATANGFTNGVSGTTITVHNPPSSGDYTSDTNYVEAIITQDRPTLFMGILGLSTGRASARAVAGVQDLPNCIYALSPTGTGLSIGGSGSTLSAACGIVVDSSDSSALGAGSGSVFGTSVTVTGGISGTCTSTDPAGCRTGIPPQADPLASRAVPQFSSSCDYVDTNLAGPLPVSINPGVYCNGINVGSHAVVTFQPGVYVLLGGGLSVSGNSTVQGSGVTFYNTAQGSHSYGPMSISGGTLGFLSAPTSGPMEGMLFFQDRTITPKSSGSNNVVAGGSGLYLEGIFYFPTTNLSFTGGGSYSVNYTIMVASTITISGNSVLSANFSSLASGNPVKKITLAE